MVNRFDELAKTLAGGDPDESGVSRRDALRRVGLGLAGAVLGSLGIETSWAAKGGNGGGGNPGNGSGGNSPCGIYCRSAASKAERDACLRVCQACPSTSLLCGTNGFNLVCCTSGTCCNGTCVDRATNIRNCGVCGNDCGSYPNVTVTCVNGNCQYACYPGYSNCDGVEATGCETNIAYDASNCGACGNVCPNETPYCNNGVCSPCPPGLEPCGGVCADLYWDDSNCGQCNNLCDTANNQVCCWGTCVDYYACYGGGTYY